MILLQKSDTLLSVVYTSCPYKPRHCRDAQRRVRCTQNPFATNS